MDNRETAEEIRQLLDRASVLADAAGADETRASDPFTFLAHLIDTALARAETMAETEPTA